MLKFTPKKILPPLLVAISSRLFFSLIAFNLGQRPWAPGPWLRWDSNLYLEIAHKGYEFVSCRAIGFASMNDACGNTGWFPGYPFLIYLSQLVLGWTTLSFEACAAWIPFIFLFLTLHLIWNRFLKSEINTRNILVLLIVVFFPGCVYFHAGFPISVTGFCLVASIEALKRMRKPKAWLYGFLAGVSYPTGFIVGGFSTIFFLLKKNLKLTAIMTLSGLAGFGSVIVFQSWQTGVWASFFQVQGKYGFAERGPFQSLFEDLTTFGTDGIHLQSTLVSIYMVGLTLYVAWRKWRKKTDDLDWAILAGAAGYWLIPHLLGGKMTSFYRGEALIFPSVLLLKDAPRPILLGILLVFGALAYVMGGLFFQSLLV
jgi:hypothetical protein